jgi:hypothetical protein
MRTRRRGSDIPAGRRIALAAAVVALAALHGCSTPSATPFADPSVLPSTWQERRPFRSSEATILARDERDADEAARLAGAVAADFRRRTGRDPSPRLLVIVGSRAIAIDGDPSHRARVAAMGEAILDGRPEPTGAELSRKCDELRDAAARVGLEPQTLLVLQPDAIASDGFVTELAFPDGVAKEYDWAIVMATEAERVAAVGALVDAAIAKEELNHAQRLLLAPILPFVRGKAVDAARDAVRSVLFAAHAFAQSDWSTDRRRQEVEAYERSLGLEVEAGPRPAGGEAGATPPRTAGS